MLVRFGLVFLVMFMVIAANLPESIVAQMGFDPDYLKVALAAWAITGMVYHRHILLVCLVLLLVAGANLPEEIASDLRIDRTVVLATLVAIVLTPVVGRWLEE